MSEFISPAIQAMNLIRRIGDEVSQSGEPIPKFFVDGAISVQFMDDLVESGIVRVWETTRSIENTTYYLVNLTLNGWERYEREKRGEFEGNYGFIAMKFDDPELDPFVEDVVKPAVKEGTGYDLVDMRDVARAGVIDNIMRVQIRDAAFVIADLTHDNYGAYWEAGYAEGLGKPVVYICEKAKFDKEEPHFDTNHCTTVLWSKDDPEEFKQKLIATLRRSLDLSARSD